MTTGGSENFGARSIICSTDKTSVSAAQGTYELRARLEMPMKHYAKLEPVTKIK